MVTNAGKRYVMRWRICAGQNGWCEWWKSGAEWGESWGARTHMVKGGVCGLGAGWVFRRQQSSWWATTMESPTCLHVSWRIGWGGPRSQ